MANKIAVADARITEARNQLLEAVESLSSARGYCFVLVGPLPKEEEWNRAKDDLMRLDGKLAAAFSKCDTDGTSTVAPGRPDPLFKKIDAEVAALESLRDGKSDALGKALGRAARLLKECRGRI